MTKSESIAKLTEALSKAQGEFGPVKKNCVNPAFRSNGKSGAYADLQSVIDATRPALTKNGLAIIQLTTNDASGLRPMVTTILSHISGEFVSAELSLPAQKPDAQGMGSAITYARRYGYSGIVGVASEEDDDANSASQPKQNDQKHERNHEEELLATLDCADCKDPITSAKHKGAIVSADRILNAGREKYKLDLCAYCQIARDKMAKSVPPEPTPISVAEGDEFDVTLELVSEVLQDKTRAGAPMRHVNGWKAKGDKFAAGCFDAKLFDVLDGKLHGGTIGGRTATFRCKQGKNFHVNIVGIVEISSVPFAEFASLPA